MFSIQTNVNSLIAQENLRVNSNFQSQTIQRLTSGYRINQSGDDAAGLAIANKFRSDVAELTQGVRNANDGISTLQILDGGMNNVSKMLDRLKTLATQSASDTFTGDRNVLNQEFQSLIGEIDRQAQGIGLDSNGQFAKSLAVYIGGGKAHGTGGVSIDNGSVTVDLRNSAVDSKSLGLKGMQVIAGSEDIGSASANHSVSKIVADTNNTTSVSGFTDFYFTGPGFSDDGKVKVSVNLQGVTDIDSLATAINSAIQTTGAGAAQSATAFKNADIVASVHTDENGGKELAFSSSSTAFQVEAGDRMANALMGNFVDDDHATGTDITTKVTGGNTAVTATAFTPTNVTVRITGAGLTGPVDLTFDAASNTVDKAITDLTAKVANNADLQAAGITVSGTTGNPLVFSNSRGEKFSVEVTGDTKNVLGMGSFVAGAAGAVDYTTITGASYDNTTASGTAHLEFSINGAASNTNAIDIDLAAGDATAGAATGTVAGTIADQDTKTLKLAVDGGADQTITVAGATTTIAQMAAQINSQIVGAKASVDSSGHLVITSNSKGAASSVEIKNTGSINLADLGLTAQINTGTSRTTSSIVDELNTKLSADTELQNAGIKASVNSGDATKIDITSSNNTYFRINAGTSGANADIGFGVDGAAFASSLTVAAAKSNVADSNGATNTTALSFAALQYGNDDQAVTISATDSTGALQSKTITLKNDSSTTRSGRSIDEAIDYINTQLQQTNNTTLQKIVAVKENVGGVEKINFLSSLNSFSVSLGSSANSDGIGGGTAQSVASAALGTGNNVSIDSKAGAAQALTALVGAIGTLGSAQAAVGKGQNQLSYALGLAQSQINNYSAAESRIRDADLASEAANLTKAQVLQQASLAAMAQANSAPQAVLALLRG